MFLTFYQTTPHFNNPKALKKKPYEVIVGKGENTGNQHFLLFPHCFKHYQIQSKHLNDIFFPSENTFNFCGVQNFVVWFKS